MVSHIRPYEYNDLCRSAFVEEFTYGGDSDEESVVETDTLSAEGRAKLAGPSAHPVPRRKNIRYFVPLYSPVGYLSSNISALDVRDNMVR